MDEDFVVPAGAAGDFVAVNVDGDDVVVGHFLETDAGRLHEKPVGPIGKPQGDMAGDIVALPFMRQYAARVGEQPSQRSHVVRSFSAAPAPSVTPSRAPSRESSIFRAGTLRRPLRASATRR